MASPRNKRTMTLRRHSTSPSSAGRAVIASVSARRTVKTQTSSLNNHRAMKSNPYVGWFRHSPSTATAPRVRITSSHQTSSSTPWCSIPVSLADSKNSPHIGWFRHAPPSRLDVHVNSKSPPPDLSKEEKDLLWKLLQELNPSLGGNRLMVSGYLRGGGKEYMERVRHRRSRTLVKDLKDSSAEGMGLFPLSRLASWFLFPVAYDAESCGYRQEDHHPKKKKKNKNKEDGLLSQLLYPYLPSFLEEPNLAIAQEDYSKYGAPRVDNDHQETNCDGGGDDDSDSSSDSLTPPIEHPLVPTKFNASKDLSLSVSSLAEAYYAHQTATKELGVSSERGIPSASAPVGPVSPHRLDYVITQMDIARMTRNASRHLDVQSILSLPVTTYHNRRTGSINTKARTKSRVDQPGTWSWTIVEESEGGVDDQVASSPQQEVDFCVICLEHFVNGDRLRVLPCDHSFHVGCIDRWLSGSQSFEECYTSGCPTCKKHPTVGASGSRKPRAQSLCQPTTPTIREGKSRSGSLDGSVPSWAFAQIGSALVAQDQGTSICSGASTLSYM